MLPGQDDLLFFFHLHELRVYKKLKGIPIDFLLLLYKGIIELLVLSTHVNVKALPSVEPIRNMLMVLLLNLKKLELILILIGALVFIVGLD